MVGSTTGATLALNRSVTSVPPNAVTRNINFNLNMFFRKHVSHGSKIRRAKKACGETPPEPHLIPLVGSGTHGCALACFSRSMRTAHPKCGTPGARSARSGALGSNDTSQDSMMPMVIAKITGILNTADKLVRKLRYLKWILSWRRP
jgi:hypothetical protein